MHGQPLEARAPLAFYKLHSYFRDPPVRAFLPGSWRLGTDRDLIGEGPCPCGNGKIRVTRCSPDHPWGGEAWYENELACAACGRTYTFARSDQMLEKRDRLVLRKDVAEREEHWKEYLAKTRAIMAMPATQQMLAKATTLLDQQQSVAAKFRFLNHHGLAGMSESTFRKRFRDSDSYLKDLGAGSLRKIAAMIGTDNPEISTALADAAKCHERHSKPIPTVTTGISGLVA